MDTGLAQVLAAVISAAAIIVAALIAKYGIKSGLKWPRWPSKGDDGPLDDDPEQRFLRKLAETVGENELRIARKIYDWMRNYGIRKVIFTDHSMAPAFMEKVVGIKPVYLSTDGKLWLPFNLLRDRPVFGTEEVIRQLMQQFNTIKFVKFTDADFDKSPGIPLATIADDPGGQQKVIAAWPGWSSRLSES